MALLCPVCSGCPKCHMLACVCTHACVCPPVCPCVRFVGRATSITLWLFIKALLPGNLVAWQHEWGLPRVDFTQAQRERKQKENERAGRANPTSTFPPLCFSSAWLCSVTQCRLSLSKTAFETCSLAVHWKHIWTSSQAGKVSVSFCLWPAAQYHFANW